MFYRIRYRTDRGSRSAEVSVEANSPAEAVVKFRHIQEELTIPAGITNAVTSVSSEPMGYDLEG